MKICFEGIDGCGKSTQIDLMYDEGVDLIVKHPGHGTFGQAIRNLILDGPQPKVDLASRFLFWADHLESARVIKNRQAGSAIDRPTRNIIVFDRHPKYSNYAYGTSMGTEGEVLLQLNKLLEPYMAQADITFVIDIPAEVALDRMVRRGKEFTAIEKRGLDYFRAVRERYLELVQLYPEVVVLDGTAAPGDIHELVMGHIRREQK